MTPTNTPQGDPVTRAYAAWYRAAENINSTQPSGGSLVSDDAGKEYVLLHTGGALIAVYRITNAGQLKRLKRWPAELTA